MLHKEFTANLQKAVDVWLASRGMTEENLVRSPLPSRGFAGEPFSFGASESNAVLVEYCSLCT